MSYNWLFDHKTDDIPGRTSIFRMSLLNPSNGWQLVALVNKERNISYHQVNNSNEKKAIDKYARKNDLID